MTDPEPATPTVPGSAEWDAVYEAADQVWSGNPNGALVAEAADLPPGAAIDVGCGEGADAVWLAERGWRVTGLDVSGAALARAAAHADAAGAVVEFVHAGLIDYARTAGTQFDLVSVQYPGIPHEDGRALAALLDLVAPGGTLLFVHHGDFGDHHHEGEHAADAADEHRADFDPADFLLPPEVHTGLGDGWTIEVFDERPRSVASGAGAGHTVDVVLRAKRAPAR